MDGWHKLHSKNESTCNELYEWMRIYSSNLTLQKMQKLDVIRQIIVASTGVKVPLTFNFCKPRVSRLWLLQTPWFVCIWVEMEMVKSDLFDLIWSDSFCRSKNKWMRTIYVVIYYIYNTKMYNKNCTINIINNKYKQVTWATKIIPWYENLRAQHWKCSCEHIDSTHIQTQVTEVPIFWWIALGSLLFLPGAGGSCVSNPVGMRGMR